MAVPVMNNFPSWGKDNSVHPTVDIGVIIETVAVHDIKYDNKLV